MKVGCPHEYLCFVLEAIHPLLGNQKRFISMKEVTAIPRQRGRQDVDEGDFSVALHLTGAKGLVCIHARWMKVLLTVDPEQVNYQYNYLNLFSKKEILMPNTFSTNT